MKRARQLSAIVLCALLADSAESEITGGVFLHEVKAGDHLTAISARFGVDTQRLALSNGLGAKAIIKPGNIITVDNSHIVPESLEEGVLINVPQRMLYLFREDKVIASYPVGLGKPSWPTPTGEFKILSLEKNKCWCVPQSIQEEMRRQGKKVVTRVPPGPDNPLGGYWIGLSMPGFGIHGTIAPSSIYRFQSHGCIRMHPEDIAQLFPRVQKGMRGRLIYEPVLLTKLDDGRILAEVHPDSYNKSGKALSVLREIASRSELTAEIDWDRAAEVAANRQGTLREIGLAKNGGREPYARDTKGDQAKASVFARGRSDGSSAATGGHRGE